MAASEHLSPELFHGTRESLSEGTILEATTPGYGTDELHSFATTSPSAASIHGRNVYLVEPVNPKDLTPDPYNEEEHMIGPESVKNYSSKAGFRVKHQYL